ncbi:MAG: hypothetical protein IKZ09_05900 [Clostridia bacterium]|nr:hypothetical protein [Clostridia bacterium]
MKRMLFTSAMVLYVLAVLLFHCLGGVMRDAVSYRVTAANAFAYDLSTVNSRFSIPEHCVYQNPENGEYFVYILDRGEQYDDDGYYIIPFPVRVQGVEDGIAAILGVHEEIIVVSEVTENMVGERAVIDVWHDYAYELIKDEDGGMTS